MQANADFANHELPGGGEGILQAGLAAGSKPRQKLRRGFAEASQFGRPSISQASVTPRPSQPAQIPIPAP